MEDIYERLTRHLTNQNSMLTQEEARTWVEYLWEDFEATRAKAGREYEGQKVTERVVKQWINSYGSKLHDFVSDNPRYQDAFNEKPYH